MDDPDHSTTAMSTDRTTLDIRTRDLERVRAFARRLEEIDKPTPPDANQPVEPTQVLRGLRTALNDRLRRSQDEPMAIVIPANSISDLRYSIDAALQAFAHVDYLREEVAGAILASETGDAHEITKLRRAISRIKRLVLGSGERRQGRTGLRFDALAIVSAYHVLTRGRGSHRIRWGTLEAIAERRPPLVVDCPVHPREALCVIRKLHGLASYSSVARYLIRLRSRMRPILMNQSDLPSELTDRFLEGVPYIQGDETQR